MDIHEQEIIKFIQKKQVFEDEKFEEYYLNCIKRDYEIQRTSSEENIHPLWVGIKVTNKCNFSCKHCWADLNGVERTCLEIYKVIDKLSAMGVQHVTLSGGEPFLRKDIFDIIRYVKNKKMHLSIYTNGSLLNINMVDELEKLLDSIDVIQVSLDGSSKNIFYAQRNTFMFDSVIHNLYLLGKSSMIIRVNMVASYYNLNDIVNVYKLCNNLKIQTFSVSYVYGLNKGCTLEKRSDTTLYIKQIYVCMQLSQTFMTKFKPFIPTQFYECLNGEEINETVEFHEYNYFLYRFTNARGDMYPEVSLEFEELRIGNIYDDSINQLIERSNLIGNKLKKRTLMNTKCAHCKALKMCKGGDEGRVFKQYGTLNAPDPICKR